MRAVFQRRQESMARDTLLDRPLLLAYNWSPVPDLTPLAQGAKEIFTRGLHP